LPEFIQVEACIYFPTFLVPLSLVLVLVMVHDFPLPEPLPEFIQVYSGYFTLVKHYKALALAFA